MRSIYSCRVLRLGRDRWRWQILDYHWGSAVAYGTVSGFKQDAIHAYQARRRELMNYARRDQDRTRHTRI